MALPAEKHIDVEVEEQAELETAAELQAAELDEVAEQDEAELDIEAEAEAEEADAVAGADAAGTEDEPAAGDAGERLDDEAEELQAADQSDVAADLDDVDPDDADLGSAEGDADVSADADEADEEEGEAAELDEPLEAEAVETEAAETEELEADGDEAEAALTESDNAAPDDFEAGAEKSELAAETEEGLEAAAQDDADSEGVPQAAAAEANAPAAATQPQAPLSRADELRLLEALLFASAEPVEQSVLAKRMPDGVDIKGALLQLQEEYAPRGVNLIHIGNRWTFRTAGDLAWLMTRETSETKRLSRAAIEVLAIVAYHQPVTRGEIEEIRGVATSKGTLDVLLETGWIRPRGRRKTPGRPLTFGTTETFLSQFNLEALGDLPGLDELKGTGLLDPRLPSSFNIPTPSDDPALREDEDPLEDPELDLGLAPRVEPENPEES